MAAFAYEAPFGLLGIEVTPRGLRRLEFLTHGREPKTRSYGSQWREEAAQGPDEEAMVEAVVWELDAYFAGERLRFDLPLDIEGGTEFQRRVWRTIAAIPFGQTLTYAQVAAAAGAPNAYRAAGSACGANPVAIVIPCHRVVGTDRRLHGFGGGLPTKAWLLEHEAKVLARTPVA
ncbi:MAG TPA: methylated-DNA--[protein]-cysteine S-methyltransferase [Dehalococcoidia bacterium]|nr:methylated-DNA--[protein]-cysteine S-methyltransferase [Dehalococcoidia bacterium]